MKQSHKEIAETLREYAEWADANIYEVPIMLPDDLRTADVSGCLCIHKKCADCRREFWSQEVE